MENGLLEISKLGELNGVKGFANKLLKLALKNNVLSFSDIEKERNKYIINLNNNYGRRIWNNDNAR